MFKHLFIDIETIPVQRADLRDLIASTVTHPGNISKAETIAKWNEEQRPAAVEEAIARTSLDGAFGQVCVISAAIDDADPVILMESFWDDPAAEKLLLESLRDWMDKAIEPNEVMGISVVGHNVSAFDLRFLIQRSIINGVRPHPVLARAAQAKPWETEKVFDTMVQWAGVGNRISMDKLCKVLGIPGKSSPVERIQPYTEHASDVIICCDPDTGKMNESIAHELGTGRCRIVETPVKIDDYILECGISKEKLKTLFNQSRRIR